MTATAWKVLAPEQVKDILTSDDSDKECAGRYGFSVSRIREIRQGGTYASLFPEIPRRPPGGRRKCSDCLYFRLKRVSLRRSNGDYCTRELPFCALELPDIREEGVWFASECNVFQPST